MAKAMKTMPKTNRASKKTGLAPMGKNPPGFEPGGPPKGSMKKAMPGATPESKKMLDKKRGERGSMKKQSAAKIRK